MKPGVDGKSRSRHSRPRHPFLQLVIVRFLEFIRRPEAIFWVYVFPLLMLLVLGSAFRSKPIEKITVDILDQHQDLTEEIVKALEADPRIVVDSHSESDCRVRLKTGKSDLYLQLADNQSGDSTSSQSIPTIEYVLDPTRPGSLVARAAVDAQVQSFYGRKDPVASSDVEFVEPGGRYIDWLVPGLLGMGLLGGGLWGVGFGVVDMRIRKLLKRFMATPMKRSHFLLAMMTSRLIFMIPEMVMMVLFAWLVFGVQVFGSWLGLSFLILLGATQFSGIGLLIGSRARTIESVSGLMNLTMLPMWTLSGIFFSYERFPAVFHPFIRALPLTPLIDSMRKLMTEGAGLPQLLPEITVMSCWTIGSFLLALWVFRWND